MIKMSTYGIKHADYVNAEVEVNRWRKLIINLCALVDLGECRRHPLPESYCVIFM